MKRFIVLGVLCAMSCFAGNPLIKDIGMSDPHMRVFQDKAYLYCGHDEGPDDRTWIMREWRIFSSTNLVDWVLEGTVSPKDNYMADDSHDCWAADAAERNGKYYFYFSDQKRGVGVMTSDAPGGPFIDPLGKPLVAPMHDPTILIDDDAAKTPYLVYGDKAGGSFHVVKLNDDMISLAEKPVPLIIHGEQWKKAPVWMDKNYIFKRDGVYYLSWGGDYATSKSIYGPYECVGAVGKGYELGPFAHGSFFEWKGQFYHIWCYYLRTGYKYRESIITYCHFDREGRIVTDTAFLDAHFANGVGQYDASWSVIEAEWFYEKSGGEKRQTADGFEVAGLKNGHWLRFANVSFDGSTRSFQVKTDASTGSVELRHDAPDGPLLARIDFASRKASDLFSLKPGKNDLYLIFRGLGAMQCAIDSFSVHAQTNRGVDLLRRAEKLTSLMDDEDFCKTVFLDMAYIHAVMGEKDSARKALSKSGALGGYEDNFNFKLVPICAAMEDYAEIERIIEGCSDPGKKAHILTVMAYYDAILMHDNLPESLKKAKLFQKQDVVEKSWLAVAEDVAGNQSAGRMMMEDMASGVDRFVAGCCMASFLAHAQQTDDAKVYLKYARESLEEVEVKSSITRYIWLCYGGALAKCGMLEEAGCVYRYLDDNVESLYVGFILAEQLYALKRPEEANALVDELVARSKTYLNEKEGHNEDLVQLGYRWLGGGLARLGRYGQFEAEVSTLSDPMLRVCMYIGAAELLANDYYQGQLAKLLDMRSTLCSEAEDKE